LDNAYHFLSFIDRNSSWGITLSNETFCRAAAPEENIPATSATMSRQKEEFTN
jgi:hypothetical protein